MVLFHTLYLWNEIRDPSLFFAFLTQVTHYLTAVKILKRSIVRLENFRANFLREKVELESWRLWEIITALFNNMRTLKFTSQPTNSFFATVNQLFGGSFQLPSTAERAVIKSNRWAKFRQHSRKLGGAADQVIDGSEKRICRLRFEFQSPHVIEKRSKFKILKQY